MSNYEQVNHGKNMKKKCLIKKKKRKKVKV